MDYTVYHNFEPTFPIELGDINSYVVICQEKQYRQLSQCNTNLSYKYAS